MGVEGMKPITITEAAEYCQVPKSLFVKVAIRHHIIKEKHREEITVEQWHEVNRHLPLLDEAGRLVHTPKHLRKKHRGNEAFLGYRKKRSA
jgi:hypothetical protein